MVSGGRQILSNGEYRMPTSTKDLRVLVGTRVRIERDGVTYKGVLMGEVYRHVRSRKIAYKRWVLLTQTYFKANDGWTVTSLRPHDYAARELQDALERPPG
jgi:hypothetical protein